MSKSIKLKNDIFLNGEICDMYQNSNGFVIKWANGLMMQMKKVTVSSFRFLLWYGDIIYKDFDMGDWLEPFTTIFNVIGDNAIFLIIKIIRVGALEVQL